MMTETSEHPIQPSIEGLTGLRAYAALWIMFNHSLTIIPHFNGIAWLPFVSNALSGPTGVNTFFVLSGFLLYLPFAKVARDKTKTFSLRSYFKRRFFRIFPAYYVQLVTLLILSCFGLYETYSLSDWLIHVGMIHNFWGGRIYHINSNWWTLPIELQFYCALPLIAFFIRRTHISIIIIALMGVAFAYRWVIFPHIQYDVPGVFGQLPGCLDLFAYGILAAFLYTRYIASFWHWRYRSLASSLAIIAGLAGMWGMLHWIRILTDIPYWSGEHAVLFWWNNLHGFAIMIVILGIAGKGPIARTAFSNPVILYLGEISYGIYLWHSVLLTLMFERSATIKAFASSPDHYENLVLSIVGYIAATFCIATLSYKYVEQPAIRYAHR